MTVPTRFAVLGAGDQWLIRTMQDVDFGRLSFHVKGGSPHPEAGFRVTRTRKLSASPGPARSETACADFPLRQDHLVLLRHLRQLPDGTLVSLKVAHGLPLASIDIEEEHPRAA